MLFPHQIGCGGCLHDAISRASCPHTRVQTYRHWHTHTHTQRPPGRVGSQTPRLVRVVPTIAATHTEGLVLIIRGLKWTSDSTHKSAPAEKCPQILGPFQEKPLWFSSQHTESTDTLFLRNQWRSRPDYKNLPLKCKSCTAAALMPHGKWRWQWTRPAHWITVTGPDSTIKRAEECLPMQNTAI